MSTSSPTGPRLGRRVRARHAASRHVPTLAWVAVVLVVLAGLLYLVGYLFAGDRLPRHAVVSGVDVGGLSHAAAVTRLTGELGPRAEAPIEVTMAGQQATVAPLPAGLTVDLAASVDAAGGGRSADPRRLATVLLGGGPTDAVVVTETDRLAAAVAKLAVGLDREPADAAVAYAGTKPVRTAARPGLALQQEAAAAALRTGFLRGAPVDLPVDERDPQVTDAEADRVVADVARRAVSGPVTVSVRGAGSFTLSPSVLADALSFVPRAGTLALSLDAGRLRARAAEAVAEVETGRARDATVTISDGKPKVVPAVDGTRVEAEALADAVRPALGKTGKARAVTLTLSGAKASFSTADAKRLGVKQVTGRFTTYFPYATYRNVNIGRAAELIDGTLLKPGDTFSLNKVVGERTKANGFTEGFIIKGDTFKKELGGGVSQSATTTYNAMFFAGLKDVQHQPHSLYIDRYPPGREATVAWPSLDLRFTNDTRYGVLVQASVKKATPGRKGSITVTMWSTRSYDSVTSSTLQKSRFTTGKTLTSDAKDCEPQLLVPGFDVDYQRIFRRDGEVVKRERFHWRYAPTNKVTCR